MTDTYIDGNFYFLALLLFADLAFIFFPEVSTTISDNFQVDQLGAAAWAEINGDEKPYLDMALFQLFVMVLIMANLVFYFRLLILHECNQQWLNDTTFFVGNKAIRYEALEALSGSHGTLASASKTVGRRISASMW
eukprot:CAMPEP_0115829124 /NCGR_PEP_ID=MMETSP0287-20121206/936_1 /TAXON_ID=412157 /ORGANISM="Chrysochromulina rotalis, Strain UIO044" /LENGTH=135 /DNA_ID=CAMNT_0003282379 /DNA_START=238 /DNA_END=642 /DNA_ORIENTATION=+